MLLQPILERFPGFCVSQRDVHCVRSHVTIHLLSGDPGKEARNNYINIFALSLMKKERESLNPLSWELRSVERHLTMAVLGLIPSLLLHFQESKQCLP